ncbi:YggS family pyridoxal phosphate-dependent enzyme [Psychrobium sp. MM17-31]|uniref:YggS family pyridoxal phosphate-dependent enzyme n=1 Tax=Psychrobium sp. MM17-31 TaxID=2917758 RepID=UPI001EF66436|nr:YggS family pyridoxal phosphate-dependent enzyme [Psychrobium sp. MM17-31]MCG7530922.1 YggS family pyridoxal phosphate-dependent enzyme [Psychrobium sp. MM17-31]
MPNITERLNSAIDSIRFFEKKSNRDENSVQLIAVSKTKPVEDITEAITAGQRDFGENYVQEGVEKVTHFNDKSLTWHFIGPLQSNKSRQVAEHFDWVHTIDRLKIAKRLNEQRGVYQQPLQVLIQVNISGEDSKSGVLPTEVMSLAKEIVSFERLTLRGLMTIGVKTDDVDVINQQFSTMNELLTQLKTQYTTVDTLSMGMSSDIEHAINNGSTMVRVGSAIFGARG